MAQFSVTYNTQIEVVVLIEADDEDTAADQGWEVAEAYLQTLGTQTGDSRIDTVTASLDGIGAESVIEV